MINRKWWDRQPWIGLILSVLTISMLLVMISPFVFWSYTQRYVDNLDGTATMGIMFEKTIYLKEYKNLGKGNGWFGDYERYSRSDRHGDVLSIYKD
mgnify:CR=1 FL=1